MLMVVERARDGLLPFLFLVNGAVGFGSADVEACRWWRVEENSIGGRETSRNKGGNRPPDRLGRAGECAEDKNSTSATGW
jgi:hypothetical protein